MSSPSSAEDTDTLVATVDIGIFGPGCHVAVDVVRDGEVVDSVFVQTIELSDTDTDEFEDPAIESGEAVLAERGYRLTSKWGHEGVFFTARVTRTTASGT